jgi:hypothetical protein
LTGIGGRGCVSYQTITYKRKKYVSCDRHGHDDCSYRGSPEYQTVLMAVVVVTSSLKLAPS